VNKLEEALIRLVYTQQNGNRASGVQAGNAGIQGMVKEEHREPQSAMGKPDQEIGHTLIEDIFVPSIDQAIENYFGVLPDIIDVKKLVRKEGKSLEIDILALCEK